MLILFRLNLLTSDAIKLGDTYLVLISDCSTLVIKVSDHGRHVLSSSLVPLKTHRVRQRCTLNLLRAEMSSRWCDVVVRKEGCQLRCHQRT
ncbi:hypothetical protein TNCV_1771641 [Trichonephila clavipes]|nr:hypothetical protein TNCV_1771641 [Trichonephila clavipes]